jgi:AAA domain
VSDTNTKPNTIQRNLAKLPQALAPLIERPQWCVWRWTQKPDGSWQKPPFMALQPDRHASTNDPTTWTDYPTALATVQAGHADGLSYVLTKDDPFGAFDLDHCRCLVTYSIDVWAQNYLQAAVNTYQEITPSGEGVRIWGFADGQPLHKKFTLSIDGKEIAVELFRKTNKALTVTGAMLDPAIRELQNVDRVFDWALVWGERRKAAAAEQPASNGNGFDSTGCRYTINEIEQIVREGRAPAGANRSDMFHAIVGHYVGCGWDVDRIFEHLQEHPQGIGSRYLAQDRLRREVERSAGKYAKQPELPWAGEWNAGWEAKAPQPEPEEQQQDDPELDAPDQDEKLDDDLEEDEELDEKPEQDHPDLPPLHMHGEADDRALKRWLIKKLIPEIGHGMLGGQWGVGKTFELFDLAACLMTGQPFLNHTVKRQCGVLLIAAEGADEVRLRLDAVVREKCGNMPRAPFIWYEDAPPLLHKGSIEKLVAMARRAEASLEENFGLPLGLIMIDTLTACAGYTKAGDDYDTAAVQAVMNILKTVARTLRCFVLGVGHLGKDPQAGLSGNHNKETSADLVWLVLADRQLSGAVTNTRLAVRKHRGGPHGQQYPFKLRMVEAPEKDEDGDPITTMVVDWLPAGAGEAHEPDDPWAECRRQDQRTAMLRLKRVLHEALAEQGVELPIGLDGPAVRMVDEKIVRNRFYAGTPAEGSPKQKGKFRRQRFNRAMDEAEDRQLMAVHEIGEITYLRLSQPDAPDGEQD